jgi:hypothetical protein
MVPSLLFIHVNFAATLLSGWAHVHLHCRM